MTRTAVSAALALAILLTARSSRGQSAQDTGSSFKYRTSADCIRCHNQLSPAHPSLPPSGVLMNEAQVWLDQDKHSRAYQVLTEARGKRIGELLGKDVLDPGAGCIQCHTSNIQDDQWLDPDPQRIAAARAEGVGCETCHGPSEKWYDMHTLSTWRHKTSDEKADFGFTPLQHSAVRAEVCLSCHVGNAQQGRVITHEMYAAGHPLLSGFESESSAERMPRHWRYAYEKDGEVAQQPDAFVRTRHVLAAAPVAMRLAVELAAADAANNRWPELARLDCFGCHHELVVDGWRQLREPAVRSGRTELAIGNAALLAVAAHSAGGEPRKNELIGALAKLRQPFERNVFGDPAGLKSAAPEVIAWCRTLETELAAAPIDRQRAAEMINWIVEQSRPELYDYDSARQLAGAAVVAKGELERDAQSTDEGHVQGALQMLADQFHLLPGEDRDLETAVKASAKARAAFQPADLRRALTRLSTAP